MIMFMNYGQPQIIGALAQAKNYNEIQSVPVAANGSPTLFLLENDPVMYMVSVVNGQKTIQGYKFEPLPTQQETTEKRLNNLEAIILDMRNLIEGMTKNESNLSNGEQEANSPANEQHK
jgi:hypothetical protein